MAIALLALAAVDFALLIWTARQSMRDPANIALLTQTILLLLLWFDVGTVGAGRMIGEGSTLELMSRIRFTWFYLTMPLLLIGVVALARQAGFAWAKPRWLMIVAAAAAIVFVALEAPRAWTATYYTACFGDTLRYISKVPMGQACIPGQEGMGVAAFSPAIPVIFLSVVAIGLLLWVRRAWPWLAVSALLFLASSAVPSETVGPYLTYPLDTLMTAAFVFAAIRFPPALRVPAAA